MRVRYEDFADTPTRILNDIGSLSEIDLNDVAAAVSNGESMHINHIIVGNRIRMENSVCPLSADREWMNKLSTKERWIIRMLAGWLMHYYKYDW